MLLDKSDMRCARAARIFARKSDHYPYSDRYIAEVHDSPNKTGRTEREHMVAWFRCNSTKGSGSYTRIKPNMSAKRCYNRLMNPASLLWIAEAAGINGEIVEKAFNAAMEAGDYRRACSAIRRIISWEMIYEKLQAGTLLASVGFKRLRSIATSSDC
ncbi:hypothetical protein BACT_0608 [Bifidobacterium actinocoloniiforme DSM 22766]|uniref:Uncharacterized protein n=1 Tax=Bifidobacterium actinocoloniiforme DSM 22766 TaxID=1437605 RepID=A0A086Z057_9BIFI|nr:hypothetical protein [Bifidobacterium actinocoloniiforme]AKV55168.1 hypothetical protein AB656_01650 [Bifidobacterium actinocoloniiforme DSM 22766]KFI39907.1 hypothetical protein BACT_0608 [Bifidobacterium actinocoloniiforme DSM 22766]